MRRVVVLVAIWLVISVAVVFAPGCYGRNCEGGFETYGTDPGQGRMLDENTWESNPQDGTWLPYPRQRYYIFDIRALSGRTPQEILPYLSAQADPKAGGNFTLGAGNLALLSNASPNRIDVRNDSCSDYFLRLVVKVSPLPPTATPAGDASDDEDASATTDREGGLADAGVDAHADAEAGP
jgi:hypothetical protein